jgi:hypothetical protein
MYKNILFIKHFLFFICDDESKIIDVHLRRIIRLVHLRRFCECTSSQICECTSSPICRVYIFAELRMYIFADFSRARKSTSAHLHRKIHTLGYPFFGVFARSSTNRENISTPNATPRRNFDKVSANVARIDVRMYIFAELFGELSVTGSGLRASSHWWTCAAQR